MIDPFSAHCPRPHAVYPGHQYYALCALGLPLPNTLCIILKSSHAWFDRILGDQMHGLSPGERH